MIALGKTKYGEASKQRVLKSGSAYDSLFTAAPGKVYTIKKDAGLSDTVALIPKVVHQTKEQTAQLSRMFKGNSVYETCKKIWHFVYGHIQYRKDVQGYEQIRSPRRTWHDRSQGVDCDCYSVFISSILTNLNIPHTLRITKYNQDHFQHIYPVVPFNGRYIIVDCVTDQFDYEVPYSEKKDYPMELQYLDGIPDYKNDGMEELGRILKKKINKQAKGSAPKAIKKPGILNKLKSKKAVKPVASNNGGQPAPKKKKKGFLKKIVPKINLKKIVPKINLKKVVSVVNKVNPAAIALRNGLLAALKLNIKNNAARLSYAYMTKEEAAKHNIAADQYEGLLKARKKLESIFSTAGGKIKNLEKAVKAGKNKADKKKAKKNKKKGVSGLGMLSYYDEEERTPTSIKELLGHDIYYSENMEGLNGVDAMDSLGELGEPVTVILAAATAAMKAISDMLGKIFKGREPNEDFTEEANQTADEDTPAIPSTATPAILPESESLPAGTGNSSNTNNSFETDQQSSDVSEDNNRSNDDQAVDDDYNEGDGNYNLPVKANQESNLPSTIDNKDDKAGFWDKNKTWLKPTVVVGGSIALIAICMSAFKSGQAKNKSSPASQSLSGLPYKKKRQKRKNKHKHSKKVAIELL